MKNFVREGRSRGPLPGGSTLVIWRAGRGGLECLLVWDLDCLWFCGSDASRGLWHIDGVRGIVFVGAHFVCLSSFDVMIELVLAHLKNAAQTGQEALQEQVV